MKNYFCIKFSINSLRNQFHITIYICNKVLSLTFTEKNYMRIISFGTDNNYSTLIHMNKNIIEKNHNYIFLYYYHNIMYKKN